MNEYSEEQDEKARDEDVEAAIQTIIKRYISLFDSEPDMSLSLAEIQNRIAGEMKRRNLRPFIL